MASTESADAHAPVPEAVARAAVDWLLALDGSASDPPALESTRRAWRAWLDADPLHAVAWQRIDHVNRQLRGVPASVARSTLAAPGRQRRRAVRLGAALATGAAGVLALRQTDRWQQALADLSTPVGQIREAVLPDGTRLTLDTATAVDLHFDASERFIVLRKGAVLVQSAPDIGHRPLRVGTVEGTVRAIGTRFTIRQHPGLTTVAVLEGAVDLQPNDGPAPRRLIAGQQGGYVVGGIRPVLPLAAGADAWTQGMLVVDNVPLADFVAELGRYRSGVLRCAPEVAGLRVSGSYPVADTDRVLASLTHALPVQIRTRTRWWVTVAPRD